MGEYWKQDLDSLDEYLKEERYKVDLFDVPLHYNMYQASEHGRDYDLTKILDGTLVQNHPTLPSPLWTTTIPSGAVPCNQPSRTGSSLPPTH